MMLLPRLIVKLMPFGVVKKYRVAHADFFEHMKDMVKERNEMLKDKNAASLSIKQSDLLTNLLLALKSSSEENKNYLDADELYGNLFIFIFAGHETTATTLTFALIVLSVYQEIQEKLYQEVTKKLGNRIPTYDDYPSLTYPQYIMKETLRVYPPVAVISKESTKDITLQVPVSNYQSLDSSQKNNSSQEMVPLSLPKGTTVAFSVGAIHNNPLYWPHPEEFVPERFDPINSPFKNKNGSNEEESVEMKEETPSENDNHSNDLPYNRYAFIPFSEGTRSCIGRKFSEVEFTFILTLIIQRYSIRLSPKYTKEQALEDSTKVLLRPKHPIELIFTKRENVPDIE